VLQRIEGLESLAGREVTFTLIGASVAVSLWAFSQFRDGRPTERFLFMPAAVREGQNLQGLLLSQLAHADWAHLAFNLITLFFFGPVVEQLLGPGQLLLIYALAGVGAALLTFAVHSRDPDYGALGASGSISGVLFAGIVLEPELSLYVMLVPIPIPAPVFAVAYLVVSIYAARRRIGNVGHEAHIGGAVTGFVLAGALSSAGYAPLLERLGRLLG
jgi:membrane associated rhomboid family serine protease